MRKYGTSLLLTAVLACLISSGDTQAASIPGSAIRVSPAISNVQLQSAQTDSAVTVSITNLTSVPLTVGVSGKDFGALNQSGAVGFFGSSYNPATNVHSLQGAMSFPTSTIYLAPHASQRVTIQLHGLNSLAAGGHFGAVLFTPSGSLPTLARPKVSIRSSVASLIFLTTADGGIQNVQLLPFHIGGMRFSLPSLTYVGFHNSGNTQSAVNGQLTLFGPRGNIVTTTVINSGSGFVLPGTSRVFPVRLPVSHTFFAMPGIYRLRLQYQDGSHHVLKTVNERFCYINLEVIGLGLALLAFLIYLGKKRGRWILKGCGRMLAGLLRIFRKKPKPMVAPQPKKRRPPLIQG